MNKQMIDKMAELIEREYERHYQKMGLSIIKSLLHDENVYKAVLQNYGPQAEREIEWEANLVKWEAENPRVFFE